MKAGRRDRRIRIEEPVITKDAVGADMVSWRRVCNMWVEFLPQSGREFIAAQQKLGESIVRLRGPYDGRITSRHRVVLDGRNLDITHIAEIGRRAGMEMVCRHIDES